MKKPTDEWCALAEKLFGVHHIEWERPERVASEMQALLNATPVQLSRNRAVIEMRLQGMTLQAIGDQWGISRERVRQIETRWLRWARNPKNRSLYPNSCEQVVRYATKLKQELTAAVNISTLRRAAPD